MKNIIIFLSIFLIFSGQIFAQGFFKLNTNPENPGRIPNPETEIGIILSHDSPIIEIGGAGGKKTKGRLRAGTLVIADKTTVVANWIGACGNTNFSSWWKPEGKIIFFKSQSDYKIACEIVSLKLNKLQEGVTELLERPERDYTASLLELKFLIQEDIKKRNTPIDPPEFSSNWTAGKTLGVAGSTIAGGLIGGFGFKKTEVHQEIKITPGTVFWRENGTKYFTPDKTEVIETTSQKFNVEGALIGAGLGLLSSYLVISL